MISDDDKLRAVVEGSHSYRECLRKLGYSESGALHRKLKAEVTRAGISTDHFGRKQRVKPERIEDCFIQGADFRFDSALKAKAIDGGHIRNECSECNLHSTWNGKPIVLHLDHINGDCYDHRLENLRMLCPNCHSQTPTYAGRNLRMKANTCIDCKNVISRRSMRCIPCSAKRRNQMKTNSKIEWPTAERLAEMVWSEPRSSLSLKLGVSDVAISKRCKALGIALPPRGYWQKQRA